MKKIAFILIAVTIASINLHAITSKGAINVEKDEDFKEYIKEMELEYPSLVYKKLSSKEKEAMRYLYVFIILTEDKEKARSLTKDQRAHLSKKISEVFWFILTNKKLHDLPHMQEFVNDEFIKNLNLKDPNVKQVLYGIVGIVINEFFDELDEETESDTIDE